MSEAFDYRLRGTAAEKDGAAEGKAPLSVTAACALAKETLESFVVTILGEVSEVSDKAGYKAVYFTIKDEKASLSCLIWNNRYATCGMKLERGMLVQVTGRFTLYAAKGRMNFDVFSLSLAGQGDLRMRVAALARKLEAEGLMDPRRKRPIPQLPLKIGVVTSPRGKAIHDVLRTLRRRYPLAQVLVAGVAVEGATAAEGIIEGLYACASAGAEVICLVRGGGSFEDLMPFNDEGLARAIAASPVVVVTGIGHEPDTTIADMVADQRASTPTAAAEAVSPTKETLKANLTALARAIEHPMQLRIERSQAKLDRLSALPLFREPERFFAGESLALDDCRQRLAAFARTYPERMRSRLGIAAARLEDLSPLSALSRGYAIARDKQGVFVKSVKQARLGEPLAVMLADGDIDCEITNIAARKDGA